MKSNYKRLGDYIKPYNQFNDNMEITELLGISNNKYFQRSHTNTIGIDLRTYRVVRTNQFAYNRATTRNGDKISIALRQGPDCIVSPSYRIFEVKDENELLPEYLMMWFRRPEFDRYARFRSHGSAHEFFEYDEMCEVKLPIPHPDKQREIVREYNIITNRIALNRQMNQKLDEAAQAIYKRWFVDFEFPDEEGKPYKTNDGEMEYNKELQKEIPKGWEVKPLGAFVETQYGYTASANVNNIGPKFLRITDIADTQIDWDNVPHCNISEKEFAKYELNNGDIVVARTGATAGYAKRINKSHPKAVFASYLVRLLPKDSLMNIYLGMSVDSEEYRQFIQAVAGGSAQPQANANLMCEYQLLKPINEVFDKLNVIAEPLLDKKENIVAQNSKLQHLRSILLSKLAVVN